MAEAMTQATEELPQLRPVYDDELAPDTIAEIAATAGRIRRGEEQTTTHEEFMKELGIAPEDF